MAEAARRHGSAPGADLSGRGRTAAAWSGRLAPQRGDRLRGPVEPHRPDLPATPDLDLELAGGQRLATDRDPDGTAEQLGVGELLPGPRIAVVVDGPQPGLLELVVQTVAQRPLLGPRLSERHEVGVEGRDGPGPRDALLVGVLLDRGRGGTRRPEPVRAHPDQLLGAALVQVGRAERLGVAGPELEDVADLDRRLDPDRAAVDGVPGDHRSHVGDLETEVP